ncbi:MAG: hypothetical protein EA370_12635 [Wenzhouxiangella sp.]|nr:MAG: hypothetical protein EA370_12635 [Wenzhouxiangella sp.]
MIRNLPIVSKETDLALSGRASPSPEQQSCVDNYPGISQKKRICINYASVGVHPIRIARHNREQNLRRLQRPLQVDAALDDLLRFLGA